jgi:membrane associated rhomboid family serine protease
MTLDLLFHIILLIQIGFEFAFFTIPVGTDKTKSGRFPAIKLTIVLLNVLIFYGSFARTARQENELFDARMKLLTYLEENSHVLLFKDVQDRVREADLVEGDRILTPKHEIVLPVADDELAVKALQRFQMPFWREKFDSLLNAYNEAIEENTYYRYGIAPDGRWKFGQLWTHMFLHGSTLHLLGNMVFLLALGCGLEECWGYGAYSTFYLLVGASACVPTLMQPADMPMIGASGAISGVMGAFIVAMRRRKIKIAWLSIPFAIFFLMFRRKPFGIARVPAYVFLTFYFISQFTFWWVTKKAGANTGVAYSVHVGGFFFGVFYGVMYEAYRSFKYPEAVVEQITLSQSEPAPSPVPLPFVSPAVSQSLDLMQRGRLQQAEFKLKFHLRKNPGDTDAIKTLLQIYHTWADYDQVNEWSARLIRQYLSSGDKASALCVYVNLVSALPEDQVNPRIPARDWMVLCEHMRRQGMNREAAIECERMARCWPDDPLAPRAYVTGGEAALTMHDGATAVRLFEAALRMNSSASIEERARRGMEVGRHFFDSACADIFT